MKTFRKRSRALEIMLILAALTVCEAQGAGSSEDAEGRIMFESSEKTVASGETDSGGESERESRGTSGEEGATEAETEEGTEEVTEEGTYSMEEITIQRGGQNIYGRLYRPEGESTDEDTALPLVILSHGFGDTYRGVEDYAVNYASHGIAAFAYDFIGGGYGSRSDGSMTEMSVLTEAKDLEAVMDYFQKGSRSGIDVSRLFLFGASQGGFVSTYVAGDRPDDVSGLVALYPAYVLQDDSRERNPDPENGPDTSSIMGMTVGRIYDVDAQSFDIYDKMAEYPGKALIIHGTADSIVPVAYSERAVKTFPDARLITIPGAGHGYYGQARKAAEEESLKFVRNLCGRQ